MREEEEKDKEEKEVKREDKEDGRWSRVVGQTCTSCLQLIQVRWVLNLFS